jgi:hypothetical protein
MVPVVIERDFDRPHSADDLAALSRSLSWCMDLYRVRSRYRYLATDGTRAACVYMAPDFEAMRHLTRNSPYGWPKQLWPATVHEAPDAPLRPEYALAVVERSFAEPTTFEAIRDAAARSCCFNLHRVRPVRTHVAKDGRRVLCVFEAPDVEAVRYANTQAGLPYDAVWAAKAIMPDADLDETVARIAV